MQSLFIDDGYTETGFIAGGDDRPAILFRYRPMTAAEWMGLLQRCDGRNLEEARRLEADALQKHVESWDVKDRSGNAVPLKAAMLLRLRQEAFRRLFAIVSGQEKSDSHPKATDPDEARDVKN